MGFLSGKKLLITGVISNRSIAYGIAQACHREGAELAFTYVGERFRDRVGEFAKEFGSDICLPMDVSSDEEIAAVVDTLKEKWGGLDGVVHSIGFAPREAISGDFLDGISRDAFKTAMDISAYSFPALAKACLPLMEGRQASVLTLTYLGSERVVPNYNTMGLAKAALEASTRYLAASLRPEGHSRQCHLGRSHQDARRVGYQGLLEAPQHHGADGAARPHRDDPGSRQYGCVPAFRSRKRHYGRHRLRRRGLPCGCRWRAGSLKI